MINHDFKIPIERGARPVSSIEQLYKKQTNVSFNHLSAQ